MMRSLMSILRTNLLLAAALALVGGCARDAAKAPKAAPKGEAAKDEKKKEEHAEKGPHGGPLVEWGEEKYHVEVVFDHGKKQATAYILDGSAKKEVPITSDAVTLMIKNVKPPVQLQLKADPQTSDPKGQASRFTGTHEQLAKEMDFEGEVSGKVGDTPYAGTFSHKDHDHDHKKK